MASGQRPPRPKPAATGDKPDGRRERRLRTERAIIAAYLALLRETEWVPTVAEIARRAGFSERSVFGHFRDIATLSVTAFNSVLAQILSTPADDKLDADRADRIAFHVETRARNTEAWLPVWRVIMRRPIGSPELLACIERVREMTRARLQLIYAPELGTLAEAERQAMVCTLESLIDFESWGRMREAYRMSYDTASAAWVQAIDRLLPPTPVAHKPVRTPSPGMPAAS